MKLTIDPVKMRARLAFFLVATLFSVPALYAQGGGGHQGGGHQAGGARQHSTSSGSGATRVQEQQQERVQSRDRIYGEHLMSEQERNQYRKRIHDAGSEKERERIRAEHRKMITERAAQRGEKIEE